MIDAGSPAPPPPAPLPPASLPPASLPPASLPPASLPPASLPPASLPVEREHALGLLYQMLLIRRFEEKSAELYTLGKIRGFLHLYIGEEAVAVGAMQP